MSSELDQFEPADDVTEDFDQPRRPSGMVVSVRLAPEDAEKLVQVAEESNRTVSQVARQAIRTFLNFGNRKPAREEMSVSTAEGDLNLVIRTTAIGSSTHGGVLRSTTILSGQKLVIHAH